MIYLILISGFLVGLIWYLGLRASLIYGAYLGGYLAYSLGLHWIMIIISVFLGAGLVFALFFTLSAMAAERPWLGLVVLALVSGPPFLVGFSFIFEYMRSDGQGAGSIESAIAGTIVGLLMAGASFNAYQRDMAQV